MKTFIATLAVVATLGAAPAFALGASDVPMSGAANSDLVSNARGELAAPAQRAPRLQIETSAHSDAQAPMVDNAR